MGVGLVVVVFGLTRSWSGPRAAVGYVYSVHEDAHKPGPGPGVLLRDDTGRAACRMHYPVN